MANSVLEEPHRTNQRWNRQVAPLASAALLGAVATTCCSIGIGSAVAVWFGVNAGWFTLDRAAPIAFPINLVLRGVAAQRRHRRIAGTAPDARVAGAGCSYGDEADLGAAAVASVDSYFLIMEIIIPLLFLGGVVHMGQWFMRS